MSITKRADKVISMIDHLHADDFETKTPHSLVRSLLDKLPKNIWKDKYKVFGDPACGRGIFLLEFFVRHMAGLKEAFPDENDRAVHILENVLHGYDISTLQHGYTLRALKLIFPALDEERLNVYNVDSLKEEFDMKFDVSAMNPPYNANTKKRKDGRGYGYGGREWIKHAKKSYEETKDYVVIICPNGWRNGNVPKTLDFFWEKEVMWWGRVKDYFPSVGKSVCIDAVIINKNKESNFSPALKKKKVLPHNSNDKVALSIFEKYAKFYDNGEDVFEITVRGTGKAYKKELKERPNSVFCWRYANTSAQWNHNKYDWLNEPCEHHYSKKVVCSHSGKLSPFYDDGSVGIGENAYGVLVDNNEQGKKLVEFFNSDIIKFIHLETGERGTFKANPLSFIKGVPKSCVSKNNPFNLTNKEKAYVASRLQEK